MSENFGDKDYGDYFKALESRLNSNEEKNSRGIEQKAVPTANVVDKSRVKPKRHKRKLRKSVIAAILVISVVLLSVFIINGAKSKAEDKNGNEKAYSTASKTESKIESKKPEKISFKKSGTATDIPATNDAAAAVVVNTGTNEIIAARNMNKRLYPASTTKIMTLLVAAENITDMNDTFTMTLAITDPLYVAEASVAGFLSGEVISMTDMLYGLILPSGADAAMGIAIKVAGSEEEFVKLMNKKVEELGLKNTHFANVSGLHSTDNYSSAYDMAVILKAALLNPVCKEVLSTYQHTTAVTPQHPDGILLSSTLFSYMYGTEPGTATILGGKTGFVNEAGYCIASYGKNNDNGNEYIIITLGNSSRWPAFYGQIDLYKEFAK